MFDDTTFGPYEKAEMKAREAFELFEQGQIIQAISSLDEAIEINPSNGAWHFNKAISLDALNRFEDAIKEYQAALDLNPSDPEILNSIAMDYTRIGMYDLAIEIFEQIQQIDPEFEPAYCNRIITYTEMGQHDMAEEMFYLAQQINPDCPVCFYNIGNNLFIRGDYKRAVHCWEKTSEMEPTHPQINFRIAQAYWMLGDKDQARKYFLKELRCGPGDIEVLLEFGVFLLQNGEIESAKEKFNRIIELEPDYPIALFYLGEIAFNSADYTAAADLYEKARTKDASLKGPAYRLAQCASMAGNKPEAKAYLVAELGLAPECPDRYQQPGRALPAERLWLTPQRNRWQAHSVRRCSSNYPALAQSFVYPSPVDPLLAQPGRAGLPPDARPVL